jgi:hypothetical protein
VVVLALDLHKEPPSQTAPDKLEGPSLVFAAASRHISSLLPAAAHGHAHAATKQDQCADT